MKNQGNKMPLISENLKSIVLEKNNKDKFPVEVFPKELQKIIEKISLGRGIHVDFLGASTLFSFGYAIGNNMSVSILENSTKLKPILYLALIGNPGSNKSSALKFSLKYFYEQDKLEFEKYQKAKNDYERWLELSPEEKEENPMLAPTRRQSILKDSTLEAVGNSLAKNPRGVAQIRDEIAGFFRDLNKYRSGSDLENYLELWSQDPVILNRASKIEIPPVLDPFLMLAGTTQPKILEKVLASILANGSGFFDRFLYVWPLFTRKAEYKKIDLKVPIASFEIMIQKVFNYSESLKESENFSFSPKASQLILEWLNVFNKHLVDSSDEAIASIYSKFDIHLQRICLILHLIDWACGNQKLRSITYNTAVRAIRLTEYFRGQSEKALDFLVNTDPISKLRPHQLELYNKLPKLFATCEGIKIAEELGFSKRSFYYFLANNQNLFNLNRPGFYSKV